MATTELDRTHALIAPGQASQKVGKGLELYLNSEVARKTWDEGDKLLGFPLSDLALYGKVNGDVLEPQAATAELTKTENAQPAVIVSSLADLATLEAYSLLGENGPYWHTGHSVGFILALVTSGALESEGAVKLGDARRKAFKHAIDRGPEGGSGFLAVQHDKPEIVTQYVEDLTKRYPLRVCLDNYDNQVVLGGEIKDLDEAMEYVRGVDPKMASLFARPPVEAAYHSDFMDLAVPDYGEAVEKIDMQIPTRGVLVAGSMVDDDGTVKILETVADIKTALIRQPTHPERWRAVMRFLRNQGVTRMTELNESPSLVSWNRRMFGGERAPINLPGVTDSGGNNIIIAWTWQASSAPVVETISQESQMEEMNEEVEDFQRQYAAIEETEDLTIMEQFLALPAPETFGGMLLWYRNWAAVRWFKDLDTIKPDDDFTKSHIGGDSLDYEVLRADVEGVFQNPVDENEAKDKTTSRLCAMATYEKKQRQKVA